MLERHGGWSAAPRVGPPDGILFLEVFGRLAVHVDAVPPSEGELWSLFRSRAEMLGWERGGLMPGALWSTHEVELAAGVETARLGWAGRHQSGLGSRARPARARPVP
ncbi:MAG: hypothetical protein AB7I38_02660 [Dehalococcoidia bacterium]